MGGRRSAIPEVAGENGRGPPLEGTVRDLGSAGDGVVATESGVVFVPGVLPGEKVLVAIERRRRGAQRGHLVELLSRSAERVEPACPRVTRCGGCPLMHLASPAQREHKRRLVSQAVGLAAAMAPVGRPLRYRRRARLHFAARGKKVLLGYRARQGRRVVDTPDCAILSAALGAALEAVREHVLPALVGEGEVVLSEGEGGAAALLIRSDTPQPPGAFAACEALATHAAVSGVALRSGGATVAAVFGDPRERLRAADGRELVGSLEGFSQAQDEVSRALVQTVVDLAEPDGVEVLELYAGHGNLTVALAPRASVLTAVERSEEAVEACRRNLRARGAQEVHVVCADAEARASGPRVEVVVLDPPRTGARGVLEGIAARRPARIVYVSCDPPTLARDVAGLGGLGYEPDIAHAFDMFPQTAHIEAVVRLARRP